MSTYYCGDGSERRKYVEETGPFGKSRRGHSKAKASSSPKKEDPHISLFGEALKYDRGRSTDGQAQTNTKRSRSTSQGAQYGQSPPAGLLAPEAPAAVAGAGLSTPPFQKDPTEIILYGYKTSQNHSAIKRYEVISQGYICEEYPRDPPMEFRRFKTVSSYPVTRVLTPEERTKANTFAGGESWIKVTFDSAQSAERVVAASPQSVNGFWVYAELYRGVPPRQDVPIPVRAEHGDTNKIAGSISRNGSLRGSRSLAPPPSLPPSGTDGMRETATLSRSFGSSPSLFGVEGSSSISSSTASSATVTGDAPPNTLDSVNTQANTTATSTTDGNDVEVYQKIPGVRKIKLRPADEAVLPTRTTAEWLASYIPFTSLLQGPIFDDQIPRLSDGRFDYREASLYWRLWFWIDHIFHTDFCGLKDE